MENRFNGFLRHGTQETVRNGSRIISVDLNHRAEATVLMRSLRVIQGVGHLELARPVLPETLSGKQVVTNLLRREHCTEKTSI